MYDYNEYDYDDPFDYLTPSECRDCGRIMWPTEDDDPDGLYCNSCYAELDE